MDLFDYFRSNKGCSVKVPDDFSYDGTVILKEEDLEGESPREIRLISVPKDALLLKIKEDKFDLRQFFNSKTVDGICKKPDYILINKEIKKIVFIELKFPRPKSKNNNIDNRAITYQLKGGYCLFNYIKSILAENYGCTFEEVFNDYTYDYVAIIKHSKTIRFSRKKPSNESSYDDFIKITTSNEAINFKEIVLN